MAENELYVIYITSVEGPSDPELAAALEAAWEADAKNPDAWHNNPEKKRKGLEGLGRLLAEWEAENGAFTEEEMARARALTSGIDVRP